MPLDTLIMMISIMPWSRCCNFRDALPLEDQLALPCMLVELPSAHLHMRYVPVPWISMLNHRRPRYGYYTSCFQIGLGFS